MTNKVDKVAGIIIVLVLIAIALFIVLITNSINLNNTIDKLNSNIYNLDNENDDLNSDIIRLQSEFYTFRESLEWIQDEAIIPVGNDTDGDSYQSFDISFTIKERDIGSSFKVIIYTVDITNQNVKDFYYEANISSDTMNFSMLIDLSVENDYEFYLEEDNGESIRSEKIMSYYLNRQYTLRFDAGASAVSDQSSYHISINISNNYDGINALLIETATVDVYFNGEFENTYNLTTTIEDLTQNINWVFDSNIEEASEYYAFVVTFTDYLGVEESYSFGEYLPN